MLAIKKNIFSKNGFSQNLLEKIYKIWNVVGLEAFIWIAGLIFLAIIPASDSTHFTVCPLSNLGFDFCPGCGLGNSISLLFRGDIQASINSHPLGILAFIIILTRIISLIKNNRRRYA